MKLYLAGRYDRREELLAVAENLRAQGHVVTSRWLDGEHEAQDETAGSETRRMWAECDKVDISLADVFIYFCEKDKSRQHGRGGRCFELGFAIGLEKNVRFIGGPEDNIFTCTIAEARYKTVDDLMSCAWLNKSGCSSCGLCL